VLIGGFALGFNGIVRQTGDVDILVANSPSNNGRWIAALAELPDGAAALIPDSNDPFSAPDGHVADEPGVIQVVDLFVVDILPKACGLSIEDLRAHIRRPRRGEEFVNVLDLHGLRLTKQGVRDKDKMDLLSIESALSALHHKVN
jgi:hypothetical protein